MSTSIERHIEPSIRVAAFIMLFAPLIGGGLILCLIFATLGVRALIGESNPPSHIQFVAEIFFVIPSSYVLGGVQALGSGLWVARLTYLKGGFSYREAVITALIVSFAFSVVALAIRGASSGPLNNIKFLLILLVISVASALICRWLIARLGILAPANS